MASGLNNEKAQDEEIVQVAYEAFPGSSSASVEKSSVSVENRSEVINSVSIKL